jgi:hypothetical protein
MSFPKHVVLDAAHSRALKLRILKVSFINSIDHDCCCCFVREQQVSILTVASAAALLAGW